MTESSAPPPSDTGGPGPGSPSARWRAALVFGVVLIFGLVGSRGMMREQARRSHLEERDRNLTVCTALVEARADDRRLGAELSRCLGESGTEPFVLLWSVTADAQGFHTQKVRGPDFLLDAPSTLECLARAARALPTPDASFPARLKALDSNFHEALEIEVRREELRGETEFGSRAFCMRDAKPVAREGATERLTPLAAAASLAGELRECESKLSAELTTRPLLAPGELHWTNHGQTVRSEIGLRSLGGPEFDTCISGVLAEGEAGRRIWQPVQGSLELRDEFGHVITTRAATPEAGTEKFWLLRRTRAGSPAAYYRIPRS